MKAIVKCVTVACLWFCSVSAMAAADVNKCGDLSIQLTTPKKQSCTLVDSDIAYGILNSGTIPAVISSTPSVFELRQTVKGPDVTLHYQCGKKLIELKAQQNMCVLQPGAITAKSSSPETQIDTTDGDWLNKAHGIVSFIVK